MKPQEQKRKQVVIIGGGFAGSLAARELEKDFFVTLIDSKDYFEYTPSILKTIVEPEHLKNIQVLHHHYLQNSRIINGTVTSINGTEVYTAKEKIKFDYLVIASGSSYHKPIKEQNVVLANRAVELKKYSQRLKEAKTVLVIGGGLVGIELAAEIIGKYPDKRVIVVHSQKKLIPRNNSTSQRYVDNFLRKRGVQIVYGEKVVRNEKDIFFTNKRREIEAEMAFLCTGITPNSSFLPESWLDDKKQVRVNSYLQLEGNNRLERNDCIFAIGDVNNIKEEKTAQGAEKQAQIVVRNIYCLEKGKKLERYMSKNRLMVISLGKYNGILTYGKFNYYGLIPGLLKNLIEKRNMKKKK